ITAPGIGKSFYRTAVGEPKIAVELLHFRVDFNAHGLAPAAEMQHRGRRDRHLRSRLGVVAQEAEVIDHRMRREPNLAGNAQSLGLGFDATLKCDSVIR